MRTLNLVIPEELYKELENIANYRGVSVLELLKSYIRIGMYISVSEMNNDEVRISFEDN